MPLRSPLWLILTALLVCTVPAWAQNAEAERAAATPREAAKGAYAQGRRLVKAGDFSSAYEQFKKAHSLVPGPQTRYWMAFCLDTLGRTQEALAGYEEFLASPFRGRAGQDKVETAQERQKLLKARLAQKPQDDHGGGASRTGGAQAAAAGKPAAPVTEPDAQPEAIDGATFAVRIRALQQQIETLQERVRRSHTRLSLLSEAIVATGVGGARAAVRFRNDLSTAFRIERVLFVLDGAVQYNRHYKTARLSENRKLTVFTGALAPGDHTLQVLLQLRGHGYGVFSYLEGYSLNVKWSHSFTVTAGKTMDLTVVAFEKGGVTTPLNERPAIRCVEKLRQSRPSTTTRVPADQP